MENQELELFQKTVIYDENNYIFIQPLCDLFKINYQNQQRFIQNDHILSKDRIKKSYPLLYPDKQKRTCLSKEGFLRWIMILNPNIIDVDVREQFKTYQKLVIDYLYGKSLVPNIKRQFDIDIRLRELNSQINKLMLEHKQLEIEKKQLIGKNYMQLGLNFPENNADNSLNPFHQKNLNEITHNEN